MDIEELQKKVIEFRDARDWEQFQSWRSKVRMSEIRRLEDLGWGSTERMKWVTPDHGRVLKDLHLHYENESTRNLP